jgi:Na+-driven multidrug efflux pump
MQTSGSHVTLRVGWLLLAVSLPLGVTLEALHAWKVQAYLGSEMRRELWRLAHAHGTLLGMVCLVFSALEERHIAESSRRSIASLIAWGAVLMPVGFFLGGILNSEGDPSLGIVLVPIGALLLIIALVYCARQAR